MFKEELKKIKGFVFDVDGVFTDGKIFIFSEGKQVRNMNVKDGYAVHYAIKKGFPVGIITGGRCDSIKYRFGDLGVKDIYIASDDKRKDLDHFLKKNNLGLNEVLYMGDDIPDYLIMKNVAIACCPENAAPEIKQISHYISPYKGGEGCVRDVIEQTMKVKGIWMTSDAFVW